MSAKNPKYRFIYNNDGTEILGNRWHHFRPLTIEDVYSYVDIVAQTPVTTFMICSGSMLTYYPSKYERPLGVVPEGAMVKPGEAEKLSENLQKYGRNYQSLLEQGTNIVELCINRAKEKGIEAFISMRMNDLHFTDPELDCPSAQSDIWREHHEWRMGDYPGWHANGALNFAHAGVREYRLNLIREQCERFDLDGIELDFMRFIVYFPYQQGQQYREVMNDFMRKARRIVAEVGQQRQRPILLTVRVPARWRLGLDKGLDVKTWVDENLVDFITISSHWLGDPALPVREFKTQLGHTAVPVYASLESGQYHPYQFRSNGMYRAIAAHCFNQGADGIYLFNFFFKEYVEKVPIKSEPAFLSRLRTPKLLCELSHPDSLLGRNKLYSLSDGIVEYGYRPNTPLPLYISPWDQVAIDLELAENFVQVVPQNLILFLRLSKAAPLIVEMNNQALSAASTTWIQQFEQAENLETGEEVRAWMIPINAVRHERTTISIRSQAAFPIFIKRFEFTIQYGDVITHGSF